MTRTWGNVQFVDTSALSDAAVDASPFQMHSMPELLSEDSTYPTVARTTLNQWVLDGQASVAPNNYTFPVIIGLSDANCDYTDTYIDITFNEKHSSDGISLKFAEDLPTFTVTYKQNGTELSAKTYTATSYTFWCDESCEGYDEILITFTKSSAPYRAVMVSYILYGLNMTYDEDTIMSAKLSEKVDVTGATAPYNTLTFTLNDDEGMFNPQNEKGAWRYIQSGQPLTAYEDIDGDTVNLGTFYIDSWEYKDATATFNCTSPLGLLANAMYDGWVWASPVSAAAILEGIFDNIGFEDYDIADDITEYVQGVLPRGNAKDAIQQVCFAIGAVIDDSRGKNIKIYHPDRNMDSTIGRNRKFQGKSSGELDEYVNGVSINVTRYLLKSEKTEVFRGKLTAGRHDIYFTEPIKTPTATNANIHLGTPFYMWVEPVDPNEEVVVEAYGYDTADFAITATEEPEVGQTPKTKEYSGLTMYNVDLLPYIARKLLEYHKLRQTLSMSYLCGIEKVGEWVGVEDTWEAFKIAVTMIESQDIDLTGGFIATAKCRGYSKQTTPLYEMGNDDLIMDEVYII